MKLIQSEIATKIRGYNVNNAKVKADPQQLIADAKKYQKWTNSRIDALAKGGVPKNVSVGRMKKTPVKEIKTVAQAKRAIARAKQLANNPLASVKNYKALIKEAEKTYGTKGAHGGWKIIADPNKPTQPIAVPRGTADSQKSYSFKTARNLISDFWDWYNRIGQNYLDSHQIVECIKMAAIEHRKPVDVAEDMIKELYGEDIYNDYLNRLNELYNSTNTSNTL